MNGSAVPTTPSVEVFPTLDALPPAVRGWMARADNLFDREIWWRSLVASALPADTRAEFVLCHADGRPVALFPLRLGPDGAAALTSPYTCLYQPLVDPSATRAELERAGQGFARFARQWPTLRLDALDADWPLWPALTRGFRRGGLVPQRFDHFGNWHEAVAGRSWRDYLAARPGALRETVRRRFARAERDPAVAWRVIGNTEGLEEGIAEYEAVYARSWKEPEPFPDFNATLMRAAAREGSLRLALLRVGETPAAAQMWILRNGQAAVLKLAHDEAFKPLSPGTLLTAHMIRHLLDTEHVTELDFGRGDDPYKQLWTTTRRQRIGLLLMNPRRPAGLLELGRALGGHLFRRSTRERQ